MPEEIINAQQAEFAKSDAESFNFLGEDEEEKFFQEAEEKQINTNSGAKQRKSSKSPPKKSAEKDVARFPGPMGGGVKETYEQKEFTEFTAEPKLKE